METLKKAADLAGKTGEWSSSKLFQMFGSLVMEQKDEDGDGNPTWAASLGRVAFWIVFGHVMYVFQTGGALAAEELNVFYALLGYQGVKLGKDALTGTVEAWKGKPSEE